MYSSTTKCSIVIFTVNIIFIKNEKYNYKRDSEIINNNNKRINKRHKSGWHELYGLTVTIFANV